MIQWIDKPGHRVMGQVMMGKIATLRELMVDVYTIEDGETKSERAGPIKRFR